MTPHLKLYRTVRALARADRRAGLLATAAELEALAEKIAVDYAFGFGYFR